MRTGDAAEVSRIYVSAWVIELRVVEGVVRFQTQFKVSSFIYFEVLLERQVGIVEPRSMEHVAARVADRTNGFFGEASGNEPEAARSAVEGVRGSWIKCLEGAIEVWTIGAAEE